MQRHEIPSQLLQQAGAIVYGMFLNQTIFFMPLQSLASQKTFNEWLANKARFGNKDYESIINGWNLFLENYLEEKHIKFVEYKNILQASLTNANFLFTFLVQHPQIIDFLNEVLPEILKICQAYNADVAKLNKFLQSKKKSTPNASVGGLEAQREIQTSLSREKSKVEKILQYTPADSKEVELDEKAQRSISQKQKNVQDFINELSFESYEEFNEKVNAKLIEYHMERRAFICGFKAGDRNSTSLIRNKLNINCNNISQNPEKTKDMIVANDAAHAKENISIISDKQEVNSVTYRRRSF